MFDKDQNEELPASNEQVFLDIHQLNPALGVMLVTAFESASTSDQLYAIKNYVSLMYNLDLGPSIIEVQTHAGSLTDELNFKAVRQAALAALKLMSAPKLGVKPKLSALN